MQVKNFVMSKLLAFLYATRGGDMGETITCFYGRLTSLGLLILLREVKVLFWKKGFRLKLQTAKMAQVIFMVDGVQFL